MILFFHFLTIFLTILCTRWWLSVLLMFWLQMDYFMIYYAVPRVKPSLYLDASYHPIWCLLDRWKKIRWKYIVRVLKSSFWDICTDHVIFEGLKLVSSCVEYWNCCQILSLCFLFNFQLKKKSNLKEVQITLIELWSHKMQNPLTVFSTEN